MSDFSLSPQAMIVQSSKTLGELLKNIRTLEGRTQAAVARDAEITPAFLSSLEQDLKLPGPETAAKLLVALTIPLPLFFTLISERLLGKVMRDSMDYADKFSEAYLSGVTEWECVDAYLGACPTEGEAGFRERVRSVMADTLS